ncbi:Alpha/Beta hydrolase protein [Stachybotrys elegans]|uniref:Alpha/Beta hydrolase protein n=1 Tax=Stachybotrys elegans TaxID=80388 RepID=A0A8K0T624_9HYPO|nr:Alpha/Beta hydrolase protein [Stachybotrys elegans]
MHLSLLLLVPLLPGSLARVCQNLTIPISISSQNTIFNLQPPSTEIQVTDFFLKATFQGHDYSADIKRGYTTISGNYSIRATFCHPDTGPTRALQILTHGIGFDRSYWDFPFHNYNYSYVDRAVDRGFSTFTWDRPGIGESSRGDPISEMQAALELAALVELTRRLRAGSISPHVPCGFDAFIHVGHSFGSILTHALAGTHPRLSQALVLTGYTQVPSFMPYFSLGGGFAPVSSIPALASAGYPVGYVAPRTSIGVHTNYFAPGDFDPDMLREVYERGQPAAPGELLTLGEGAGVPSSFAGPVLAITGEHDTPFCGGNCYGTSVINDRAANLVQDMATAFPNASAFNATVVPGAGHGLNFGYSHALAYDTILSFLENHV